MNRQHPPIVPLVVLALGAAAAGADPPKFTGNSLPTPPAQMLPWKINPTESKLPPEFISAATALFDLGLSDPRQCEYRQLTVTVGSVWSGDGGTPKVHGWLLPAAGNEKQRFAILWNGLVYPVLTVGEKADLKSDVESLLKADAETRATYARNYPDRKFDRWATATPEDQGISENSLLPIKAALLLRLGETALAENLWTAHMIGTSAHLAEKPDDPFEVLSTAWLWARFDRAVTAHMRGDDHLSLIDAQGLKELGTKADAAAQQRGMTLAHGQTSFYDFLQPATLLLADAQRRLAEPARLHVLDNPPKFPDPAKRIAALILDLDQVNARQMGQPGGVSVGSDPIVKALIGEGEAAVEPLLLCLEKDDRLTRSVHFGRDFSPYRSAIKVYEAAYVALSGITGQSFFAPASTGDDLSQREGQQRQALAAQIRTYWEKNKGKSQTERWFAVLLDDTAEAHWAEAAAGLTRRSDVVVTPSSMFGGGWTLVPQHEPDAKIALLGDALRAESNPSLGDLLVRRMKTQIAGSDDSYSRKLRGAGTYADALLAWDPQNRRDDIALYSAALIERYSTAKMGREYLCQLIAEFTGKRIKIGDDRAYKQYADWIVTTQPHELSFGVRTLFTPLWLHPAQPDFAAASEKLFNSNDSPWNPLVNVNRETGNYNVEELLHSPLVSLPPVRKQLLALLENKTRAGTIKVTAEGGANIEGEAGWSTGTSMQDKDDPLAPPPGVAREFRVCDDTAYQLFRIDGFPRMDLYRPLAQRDESLQLTRDILLRYGPRLASKLIREDYRNAPDAAFSFDALDHPATPQDVASGLAIFSLDGERRIYKLPVVPPNYRHPLGGVAARWENLHTVSTQSFQSDPVTGTTRKFMSWRQDGTIWQAEEQLVNGVWERWFGFVGPGFLGKVKASEVILDLSWGVPIDHGVEWRLELPAAPLVSRADIGNAIALKAGDPITIKLHIRNVLGVAQKIPAEWFRPGAFLDGVSLHVQKADDETKLGRFYESRVSDGWSNVPLTFAGQSLQKFTTEKTASLDTAEELPPTVIDLQTLGLATPGIYRIWLEKSGAPYVMQPELIHLSPEIPR